MVVFVNRYIPKGLIGNSFQMSYETYPNSRGALDGAILCYMYIPDKCRKFYATVVISVPESF